MEILHQDIASIKKEINEFIHSWGEAWSPREKAPEFQRERFTPFYLQTDELLAFDFTDAQSRTVFKGAKIHADTWELFVRNFQYWTFTPVPESIQVYPHTDNAAVTLYVDNYGKTNNGKDGKEFRARAHATLLLEKHNGRWVIVHENIWGPVNE